MDIGNAIEWTNKRNERQYEKEKESKALKG
jgi:hypothetical protein